jgi:hypothetical protein
MFLGIFVAVLFIVDVFVVPSYIGVAGVRVDVVGDYMGGFGWVVCSGYY